MRSFSRYPPLCPPKKKKLLSEDTNPRLTMELCYQLMKDPCGYKFRIKHFITSVQGGRKGVHYSNSPLPSLSARVEPNAEMTKFTFIFRVCSSSSIHEPSSN